MEATMESKSLGVYIRILRERIQPRMTQRRLAELIGAAGNTIHRIEVGAQQPETYLAAILATIGGRAQDVLRLQADGSNEQLAQQLAEQAVTERDLLTWANTDHRRMELLRRIRAMSDGDPELRSRIEGYLDRLQDH